MSSEILQIKGSIAQNNDIISHQFHTYAPYTTAFNVNDEIRITIQSQDLIVAPWESYLKIELSIAKEDGTPFGGNEAMFSINFITFLFSEIRYELNGVEIDRCKMPGITTLMKNMIACQSTDLKSYLLFTNGSGRPLAVGTYHIVVPLRFLFGFCDDFRKVILNSKHELILVRSRTNTNMFIAATETASFTVNRIQWKVPHITLGDGAKLTMLKTLSRNESLFLPFRSWDLYEFPTIPEATRNTWSVKTTSQVNKPRYVVIGFQTNRMNVIQSDASLFDHCNISNIKLYLNNEKYPYDDMNVNFATSNYQELYHMFQCIQNSFYNGCAFFNPSNMNLDAFAARPIFAFDCSRSDDSIKVGMVDIRVEIESRINIPANTSAYCLIIHDNLFEYSPFTSRVHRVV